MDHLHRTIIQKTPNGADLRIPKAAFYFLTPMLRDYRHLKTHSDVTAMAPEICRLDKRDIDLADVVFVNSPRPSYGTAMEIIYAYGKDKVVVTVVDKDSLLSPWVAYHSTHISHSLDSAIEWVVKNVR